jgi:hypothetical protein
MVMPVELIQSIKERARTQGLSITAYISALVLTDLGRPSEPSIQELADQVLVLQRRVEELSKSSEANERHPPSVDLQ